MFGPGTSTPFGRWPAEHASPKKTLSYQKSIEAFLAHARFMDPPLQVVHIPFEGKEIIGYMRLPKGRDRASANGDRGERPRQPQEDLSESFSAILPYGIGFIAVDGPGTGQSPVKASPNADRALSRVIDYLQTRPEVDKSRLAMHGVSWGAYWGTKMAIVEKARLKVRQRSVTADRLVLSEGLSWSTHCSVTANIRSSDSGDDEHLRQCHYG